MPSPLDFPSTASFRNALIVRNLSPYSVPGVYSPPSGPRIYEVIQRDLPVIDSDDNLILNDPFADILYPLNAYGPSGGYNKNINAGNLANTKTNLGEYDYSDANLLINSEQFTKDSFNNNIFNPSPNTSTFTVGNTIQPRTGPTVQFYTNYGVPTSFVPSSYSPYQLLLQDNPQGTNGRLSQDSYLARLGATTLRNEFRERIARELTQNTIGRVNLPNAVSDPIEALQILQGKRPLIERDWVITRPSNLALRGIDFTARLSGAYYPSSPIPGEYFQFSEQNLSLFGQISAAFNNGKTPSGGILGKVMGLLSKEKNPSQLFLDNTGDGQKSQLFYLLDYNKYTPTYERSNLGLVNTVRDFFRSLLDKPSEGGYYVGSKQSEPSLINSPSGDLPLNSFGQEVQSPVYGPEVLSNLFEGDQRLKFGFNGKSLTDGGGIDGGFVWTSQKYNNPGFKATVGGDQGPEDSEFNLIKSQIDSSISQNYNFKQGSILDITQRLVDSTPNGSKRLSHVGNAINQLSKVFNDGYKEITKGSKVIGYTNPSKGQYVSSNIYCRVFTKDTPYYTYADLQKTDGNIRKFTYSILDNTYNLNIAPLKNPGSTNIVDNKVKKYMFSLENLAWRTSNRPGFTYDDLPVCERGPNGGRIMWFPPYDLQFNESATPSFQDNDFLGRPEPVYTYKNTKRTGSVSWKIIVDHPSILNTIVNNELRKETNTENINAIVDSFFAGCLKYDIYELAKRWNTLSPNELFEIQKIITDVNLKGEDLDNLKKNAQSVNLQNSEPNGDSGVNPDISSNNINIINFSNYENLGFYFDNDYPDPKTERTTATANFQTWYNTYTSPKDIKRYQDNAKNKQSVDTFFEKVIINNYNYINSELLNAIQEYFESFINVNNDGVKPNLKIFLKGSASSPNTKNYNINLSKRRIDSVKKYFETIRDGFFKPYVDNKNLEISESALGEETTVTPRTVPSDITYNSYNCTDADTNNVNYDKIYSVDAMACRRVVIDKIVAYYPPPVNINTQNTTQNNDPNEVIITPPRPTVTIQQKLRDGISKKILRRLLSECDYFELIKESNPMFYDSVKEKLKYFSPAFHSITPEGLNSRLTFLQQCTRPGDTIPVIGTDGKPKYDNATNTNFGAPPVLVLRIGDFFHTKIVPTGLQIGYDPLVLDINPEGIGVQPMIAKVTLNFNFVGGQGLKEPINKLQNALSFNYYANTEMFDERADATDDSYKVFDEDLKNDILSQSQPVLPVNNNIENAGGQTIGTILTQQSLENGISGTTSYQKIMGALLTDGQTYIDSVYNKFNQIITNYNLPLVNLLTQSVKYNTGNILQYSAEPKSLKIIGKSDSYESLIISLTNKIIDEIEKVNSKNDDGYGLIKELYNNNCKKTYIKQFKLNLINYLLRLQENVILNLTEINNEFVSVQQKLITDFSKIDFVATLSDGYINSNQDAIVYNLLSTTGVTPNSKYANTLDELVGDYKLSSDKLNSYYQLYNQYNLVNKDITINNLSIVNEIENFKFLANTDKLVYVLMSNIILNSEEFNKFTDAVLKDIEIDINLSTTNVKTVFNNYFKNKEPIYRGQYNSDLTYFKGITSEYNLLYKKWSPFDNTSNRVFNFNNFTPATDEQKTRIQNIYKNGNSNEDTKVFNGKNKLN